LWQLGHAGIVPQEKGAFGKQRKRVGKWVVVTLGEEQRMWNEPQKVLEGTF
jgi:hypothetical protein